MLFGLTLSTRHKSPKLWNINIYALCSIKEKLFFITQNSVTQRHEIWEEAICLPEYFSKVWSTVQQYTICIMYRIPSVHNNRSLQWYNIYNQVRNTVQSYTICILYYIPSVHNNISLQWYNIYNQVTLRWQVSTVNGHLQADTEHFDVEYIYGFVMLGVCTASRWRHRATIPAYRHACARNTVT